MSSPRLLARVDGALLSEDEARALWKRFSDHMEAHRGDLAGFAAAEGFKSVRPSFEDGSAILLASHSEAQVAYTNVSAEDPGERGDGRPKGSSSGSPKPQARGRHPTKKR